ncbi:MAG TPA: hypothetical protein VLD18_07380 [Verrucomicrobiae bacterium]|jgi:hypothetical protein|nr:hypothetical protein [Verrucomicrobiae bacterium]
MKFLKIAFRYLQKHSPEADTARIRRGAPWCCGEHSNVHVRQPRTTRADLALSDAAAAHKLVPSGE